MKDRVYTDIELYGEKQHQDALERRKNAIKNMIFFRNDKPLYVFWRNVYKRYRDAVWKQQEVFQTKEAE